MYKNVYLDFMFIFPL